MSRQRPATPQVSIVVPVFNEAANIRPLVEEIREILAGRLEYELIFVDDGSEDGTAKEIEDAIRESPRVSMCWHGRNRGQSAALRTGVSAAQAEVVVSIDGDGQNDPDDIPTLYERLTSASDLRMVVGERIARRDSWLRRLSSRVANSVRARFLHDGVRDTGCGIKVFYRDEFLGLPSFDHMHRFLPALVQRNGGVVCAMPVNHRPRMHGVSKYGVNNRLWAGISDLLGVRWLQKRRL